MSVSLSKRARVDRRFRLSPVSPSRLALEPAVEAALRTFAALALAGSLCLPRISLAQNLQTDCVHATVVGLRWDAPRGASRFATYEVRRDGVLLTSTRDTAFVDATVVPSTAYAYS